MNVCPILVGRDHELSMLLEALGAGGVVLVAGEAGIGKSRLVREFADHAAAGDHPVVWGRPESVTKPGPYSLIVDLLDDIGAIDGAARADALELLDALTDPSDEKPEPPARQIAARLRGIVQQVGDGPVLMIEDLHSSDEPSQAVIAHLARSAVDDGVLLVGTYRSEETGAQGTARLLDLLTRDRLATTIDLAPLSVDALRAMLEAMWGEAPGDDDVRAIASLGEGIPFFIEELAGSRAALAAGGVPRSIARAVETRWNRLDPAGRAVVNAASLMRGALDPAVLAEVCDVPESDVPRHLIAAVGAGLLTDQEDRLVFRHSLVRDAIAERIVSVERLDMHSRLASAIEKHYAAALDPHASALAEHHLEAGNEAEAARYAVIAGERALSVAAVDDARAAFSFALDLNPDRALRARGQRGLADVYARSGDLGVAATLYAEAADAFEASGSAPDAVLALSRAADVATRMRDEHAATAALARGLALAKQVDAPALVAKMTVETGYTLLRAFGEIDQGEPFIVDGLAMAREVGDPALLADACEGMGWLRELRGDHEEATRFGDEAGRLAIEAGDPALIAKIHGNHAVRLAMHGHCEEALTALDRARDELVRGLGSTLTLYNDHLRAWVRWRQGMPVEADRIAARLDAVGFVNNYVPAIRAWAAVETGDPAGARGTLSRRWETIGGESLRARAFAAPEDIDEGGGLAGYLMLAEILVDAVDPHPAPDVVARTRTYFVFCRASTVDIAAHAAAIYARVATAAGDHQAATEALEEAEEGLAGSFYPLPAAAVEEARGGLALVSGDADQAAERFARAATLYEQAENRADRARALRLRAAVAAAAGEAEDAIEALKGARALAEDSGAVAERNRIDLALRDLGVRPRAGRPKGSGTKKGSLTAREEEVVALVAAGATNGEIATRLFLSERTVQDHIARAQKRLDLNGRAALAAWAAKQGLV